MLGLAGTARHSRESGNPEPRARQVAPGLSAFAETTLGQLDSSPCRPLKAARGGLAGRSKRARYDGALRADPPGPD